MSIGIIAAIIIAAVVGMFLIWRTIRLFVRLAIAGVVVLLVAGLFAWNHWSSNTSKQDDNRPAKTRKSK